MLNYEDLLKLSQDFTKEFCKAINESLEYKQAARGWGI